MSADFVEQVPEDLLVAFCFEKREFEVILEFLTI